MGTLYPQLPLQSSQNFPVPTRARANAQDLDAARLIKRLDRAIRRGLKPPHRSPRRERVVEDNEAAVQDQFNAVAYGGQIEHRVLSLRLQEVAARVSGTDEGGAQEFKTQQLTFDFFAESRAEELARFEKCTRAVARGLDGPVQENLVQVSQRVAARFSVSIKVSGAMLDGVAGGAEKSANAQEALIERFLA
ncbi:MAG TPA: hypothetical protein HPP83_09195, partial [Candidatus Hydrogenedentes bacterium]|nr:hypothetical protein [Candidatus Hydrogenedentota bacterium]